MASRVVLIIKDNILTLPYNPESFSKKIGSNFLEVVRSPITTYVRQAANSDVSTIEFRGSLPLTYLEEVDSFFKRASEANELCTLVSFDNKIYSGVLKNPSIDATAGKFKRFEYSFSFDIFSEINSFSIEYKPNPDISLSPLKFIPGNNVKLSRGGIIECLTGWNEFRLVAPTGLSFKKLKVRIKTISSSISTTLYEEYPSGNRLQKTQFSGSGEFEATYSNFDAPAIVFVSNTGAFNIQSMVVTFVNYLNIENFSAGKSYLLNKHLFFQDSNLTINVGTKSVEYEGLKITPSGGQIKFTYNFTNSETGIFKLKMIRTPELSATITINSINYVFPAEEDTFIFEKLSSAPLNLVVTFNTSNPIIFREFDIIKPRENELSSIISPWSYGYSFQYNRNKNFIVSLSGDTSRSKLIYIGNNKPGISLIKTGTTDSNSPTGYVLTSSNNGQVVGRINIPSVRQIINTIDPGTYECFVFVFTTVIGRTISVKFGTEGRGTEINSSNIILPLSLGTIEVSSSFNITLVTAQSNVKCYGFLFLPVGNFNIYYPQPQNLINFDFEKVSANNRYFPIPIGIKTGLIYYYFSLSSFNNWNSFTAQVV